VVEESFQTYSEFYFLPTPETISYSLGSNGIRLDAATNYELRVCAIDTFGNASETPLIKSFRSAGAGAFLSIEGPAVGTENDMLDYTFSLGRVTDIGTVVVDVAYEGDIEFLEATSLSTGLDVVYATERSAGNLKVVLSALELPGLSFDDAAAVLKLSFKATGEGAAKVTLVGGTGGAYLFKDGGFDNTTDVEVTIPDGDDATVVTDIAKYFDPYDFNRDGKLSVADLTYVQAFYMASQESGGERWAHVIERGMDVSTDGVIDVADFILIIDYLYGVDA
jgi:hypothetical protein